MTRASRTSTIEFLGLTKTCLPDIDGELLASALAATPRRRRRDATSVPGKERLDLTQIDFGPDVQDRLYEAGTAAGVEVFISRRDGPALARR